MNDVIAGMIDTVQGTHKTVMEEMAAHREIQRKMLDAIQQSRREIQDLIGLQREHRIGIMALIEI